MPGQTAERVEVDVPREYRRYASGASNVNRRSSSRLLRPLVYVSKKPARRLRSWQRRNDHANRDY